MSEICCLLRFDSKSFFFFWGGGFGKEDVDGE